MIKRSTDLPRRRGPKTFKFTYKQIAAVAGLAVENTMRKATGKHREYDPADLGSLVGWLLKRAAARKHRRAVAEEMTLAEAMEIIGRGAAIAEQAKSGVAR